MSQWTERIPVAFPSAMIDEANALAALIDPDVGGAATFSEDQLVGGYVVARIPFISHFEPIVRARDADTWQAIMAELAAAKGVEPIPVETLDALRESMLYSEECSQLGDLF